MKPLEVPVPSSSAPPDPVGLQMTLYRHGKALIAYVAQLLPPSLAGTLEPVDVVQDVYLEAMRRSAEFRPNDDDHVRRWLKTIARHRVVDLARHHEAAKRGGLAARALDGAEMVEVTVSLLERLAVYHRTPSQSAAAHEMAALVHRSIADLPADYARVLRLRYIDGLSRKTVAAQLEQPEQSVNLLCVRAIRALRDRLRSQLSLG